MPETPPSKALTYINMSAAALASALSLTTTVMQAALDNLNALMTLPSEKADIAKGVLAQILAPKGLGRLADGLYALGATYGTGGKLPSWGYVACLTGVGASYLGQIATLLGGVKLSDVMPVEDVTTTPAPTTTTTTTTPPVLSASVASASVAGRVGSSTILAAESVVTTTTTPKPTTTSTTTPAPTTTTTPAPTTTTTPAPSVDLAALFSTVNALGSSLNGLGTTVNGIGASLNSLSTTVNSIGVTVNSLGTTATAIGATVNGHDSQITSLNVSLGARIDAIERRLAALEDRWDQVASNVPSLLATSIDAALNDAGARAESLWDGRLSRMEAAIEALEATQTPVATLGLPELTAEVGDQVRRAAEALASRGGVRLSGVSMVIGGKDARIALSYNHAEGEPAEPGPVPDVVGSTETLARRVLVAAGFVVGVERVPVMAGRAEMIGRVVEQRPGRAAQGETVTVRVVG